SERVAPDRDPAQPGLAGGGEDWRHPTRRGGRNARVGLGLRPALRRAPLMCGMLVGLGLVALLYERLGPLSWRSSVGLLLVIGFLIFGPQVLLVGTAAADLARAGSAAAAAGFVDFFGYLGAAAGDWVTPLTAKTWGWSAALHTWVAWAFLAAA